MKGQSEIAYLPKWNANDDDDQKIMRHYNSVNIDVICQSIHELEVLNMFIVAVLMIIEGQC